QMVPLHGKFIIDYPLETLKNIGITNLTIVLGGPHFSQIVSHVKDGSHLGMTVNYVFQEKPAGIAQAVNLCQKFVDDEFVVILGDNIFDEPIKFSDSTDAQIVLYNHEELYRFGVAGIDNSKKIKFLEEKPKSINSDFDYYAITGCYKFDSKFFEYFKDLKVSPRGEYEIVSIIEKYLENDKLSYTFASGLWSDAGTHETVNFLNYYFYQKSIKELK
ncbi:MAG TPA: sugar phosphate nucleotidyltransferase, partial [Gammaproteobacteria bacterium]|nr:sugar phosphate nucleotidyltransferase [Gammaproteobacteria bacterium]